MSNWQPITEAVADGSLCALRFRDSAGQYDSHAEHFFHDNGRWYRVDPPTLIEVKPTHFLKITEQKV